MLICMKDFHIFKESRPLPLRIYFFKPLLFELTSLKNSLENSREASECRVCELFVTSAWGEQAVQRKQRRRRRRGRRRGRRRRGPQISVASGLRSRCVRRNVACKAVKLSVCVLSDSRRTICYHHTLHRFHMLLTVHVCVCVCVRERESCTDA